MSGEPKTIKFQFLVDEASLSKTRQFVRELVSDLQKLNDVMGRSGIMGGSGAGGQTGGGLFNVTAGGPKSPESQRVMAKTAPMGRQLVQNFLDQKQIFKGIADGSKDSLRLMNEGLKQAIDFQKRELKDLDTAAKHLAETYDELSNKAKSFIGSHSKPAVEAQRDKALVEHTAIIAERKKAADELARLQAMAGGGKGGKPPFIGAGGSFWDTNQGVGSNLFGTRPTPGWLTTGLRVGGVALAGANTILSQVTADNLMMNHQAANRGKMAESEMRRLFGGDIKGLLATRSMDAIARDEMFSDSIGSIGTANVIKGGLVESAKGVVGAGNRGVLGAWSDPAMADARAARARAYRDNAEAARAFDNIAADKFGNELGQRVSFQRLTGTGGLGEYRDPVTGALKISNTYGNIEAKLIRQGYNPAEYASATSQLRNMAGSRFAGRNAWSAMAAGAEGLGGFSELMGSSARSGGGMEFALGALGGGVDRAAGVQLGQSIVGNGFDPRGTTSGLGVLAAIQNAGLYSGGASDFNLAQRMGLGLQAGNSITSGSIDPYQQARNLVGAIGRTGPGASTYTQDFLANGLSMKQMIDIASGNAGGTSIDSVAKGYLGGDYRSQIRGQLGESVTSVLDRFVDEGMGGDRLTSAVRKFRNSGSSDLTGFLKKMNKEDRAMLGHFYGEETGVGLEGGIGLMDLLSGVDGAGKVKRGGVGRGVTGTEKSALESQADMTKQVNDRILAMFKDLEGAYKEAPKSFQRMKDFGENLGASADAFIKALGAATKAVDEYTAKMEGRDAESVRKKAASEAVLKKMEDSRPFRIGGSF